MGRHPETPVGAIGRRADRWVDGAQIKGAGNSKGNRRTVGDWKPSILLLDLEFVTYLGCVLFCVPVHVRFFVRRLDWFHTLLLWGRGRHIIGCAVGSRMRWRLFRWRPRHWERRRSRLAAEYASCGSLWCNEEPEQGKRLVACTRCRQLGMQLATYVGSCDRERRPNGSTAHTGPQKPKEGRGRTRTARYCALVSAGRPGKVRELRVQVLSAHGQRRTTRRCEYCCPRHDSACDDGCFTGCLWISRGTMCSRRPGRRSSGSGSGSSSRARVKGVVRAQDKPSVLSID